MCGDAHGGGGGVETEGFVYGCLEEVAVDEGVDVRGAGGVEGVCGFGADTLDESGLFGKVGHEPERGVGGVELGSGDIVS